MINLKFFSALFLLTVVCSSCALLPQQVHLTPMIIMPQANIGQGRPVEVMVIDERKVKTLGHRSIMNGVGVITLVEDPAVKFKRDIERLFEARGFTVASGAMASDIKVGVRIKSIGYRMDARVVAIVVSTEANIGVEVMKQSTQVYRQDYHAANETTMILAPTASENENFINETIAQIFMQMVKDDKLFSIL